MVRILILSLSVSFLVGCAKVKHLPQLLTLKKYAETGEATDKYVETQSTSFNQLREDVQNNKLEEKISQEDLVARYGEPVYIRKVARGDKQTHEWLYRHPTEFFNTDKAYFYFDTDGNFIDWTYEEAKKKEDPDGP